MQSDIKYTTIGIFVITFFVALVAFGIWLGKYNQDEKDFTYYRVLIKESVSGLNPDASVKYNGVDVGKVTQIQINPSNSEEVMITLKILKTTPVKVDSHAILKSYGITGLAFVEILGGHKDSAHLLGDEKQPPIIQALPSLSKRLDETLNTMVSKLSLTLDQTNKLLSDKNINNTSKTIENLHSLVININSYQGEIKKLLQNANNMEQNLSGAIISVKDAADDVKITSSNLNNTIKTDLTKTLKSLEQTSITSQNLIKKLQTSYDRGDYDIDGMIKPTLYEIQTLIEQTKHLLNDTQYTIDSLQHSPSDILFKKSNPKLGPGE